MNLPPAARSRKELEAWQLGALRSLLGSLGTNRFYNHRLRSAGIDADLADLATFRERLPFTRKSELTEDQRAHPPYGSNLTFPLDQYTRYSQTSATMGMPLRWLDTAD